MKTIVRKHKYKPEFNVPTDTKALPIINRNCCSLKDSPHVSFQRPEPSFSEVLDLWLSSNLIHLKESSVLRYLYLIDTHIRPELGTLLISELTAPMINSFLNQKLKHGRLDHTGGLSPAYVKSISLIISSALQFAVNEHMCEPLRSPIHKPSAKREEKRVLSIKEQIILEEILRTDTDPTKLGILLSLYTGLRIGEICALQWDDIDLENNIMHVRHSVVRVKSAATDSAITSMIIDVPKTSASIRSIPLSSQILPLLLSQKEISKSPFVVSTTSSFLNPRTYDYRFHRLVKQCGLEPFNYHTLRHTFATRCIESGVDLKSLSEILGHSSVAITMDIYVHSSMETKRKEIEKLTIFK